MTKLTKLKPVFLQSLPVLAGYVSLGIAFGILLRDAGYGLLWALGMSVCIFAGSAQFLCVTLLANQAPLLSVGVLVFLLNFRHFFYGLSMISRYRETGKKKPYLIFALTDETYALLSTNRTPEGLRDGEYYFWLSLMNQSYWVLVIYCIRNVDITTGSRGIPEIVCILITMALHAWKRNTLLSICAGTALYMLLVQMG